MTDNLLVSTLEKSYPNFHIEGRYLHIDKAGFETINDDGATARVSIVAITTNENCWLVALEQKDYNEVFVRRMVGETEYERLDGQASGPVKGHRRLPYLAAPVENTMAKKISVPERFDLGNIWCKAAGFYEMNIFVAVKGSKL